MSDIDLDDHHIDCLTSDCLKKHKSEQMEKSKKDTSGIRNEIRELKEN